MTESVKIELLKGDACELLHVLRYWSDAIPDTAPAGEQERCIRIIGAICTGMGEPSISPWDAHDMAALETGGRNNG